MPPPPPQFMTAHVLRAKPPTSECALWSLPCCSIYFSWETATASLFSLLALILWVRASIIIPPSSCQYVFDFLSQRRWEVVWPDPGPLGPVLCIVELYWQQNNSQSTAVIPKSWSQCSCWNQLKLTSLCCFAKGGCVHREFDPMDEAATLWLQGSDWFCGLVGVG